MIKLIQNLGRDTETQTTLSVTLSYDQRIKARLKCEADNGDALGLFLERGKVIQDGDILLGENGEAVRVIAKNETLVSAQSHNWSVFSECCYHLGNRHLPLQILEREIRFVPDHVIEDLVRSFGFTIQRIEAPFEPESGAYSKNTQQGKSHAHFDAHHHGDGHHAH